MFPRRLLTMAAARSILIVCLASAMLVTAETAKLLDAKSLATLVMLLLVVAPWPCCPLVARAFSTPSASLASAPLAVAVLPALPLLVVLVFTA